MSEKEYQCGFCHRKYESWTEKFSHRCSRRPRTVCKYEHCSDTPIDNAGFCRKHRPKPFQTVYGIKDKDITENEIGIYEVTFHYSMEETVRVESYDEHSAKNDAKDIREFEGEYVHTPHIDVEQVGTKTKKQININNVVETDKGKIRQPKTTLNDFNTEQE